jgi:hypothetical protein
MKRVAVALVCFFFVGAVAWAIDRPPAPRELQKAWLAGNLATDMQASGIFGPRDYQQASGFIRYLKPQEIQSLADLYYRTRSRAEQDVRRQQLLQAQVNPEQVSPGPAQPVPPKPITAEPDQTPAQQEQAKAEREELDKLCAQLASARKPVQSLSGLIYASLPGWCAKQYQGAVPSSYYANGLYVGPLSSAAYAGPYATAVYNVYQVSQVNLLAQRRAAEFAARQGTFPNRNGNVTGPTRPYVPPRPIYVPPASSYGRNQGTQPPNNH